MEPRPVGPELAQGMGEIFAERARLLVCCNQTYLLLNQFRGSRPLLEAESILTSFVEGLPTSLFSSKSIMKLVLDFASQGRATLSARLGNRK